MAPNHHLRRVSVVALTFLALSACRDSDFEFDDPARGPGEYVGNGSSVSKGEFAGGNDEIPPPLEVVALPDSPTPDCGAECVSYCSGLDLDNPINRGICQSMWGVGLEGQPIVRAEACRRLFVDMIGRFPTRKDMIATCDGKTYGEVVRSLISRDEFVELNQRRWADKLLYDTQAVSVERIYDMDNLVGKVYRGEVAYDHFAAIVSAHPVLTRRYDNSEDRTDALFWLFMGRPPLGNERADMARLFHLWSNGYYDHPDLQMRLPDSHIRFRCIDEDGNPDPTTRADCTSVLWGHNELILKPDIRARSGDENDPTMWSGLLKAEEWEMLQLPGKLLSREPAFWEAAVDDVLEQYMGYDLGTLTPKVRDELVKYLLEYNGDIRSVHFAVATSFPYLQSVNGSTPTPHRWTLGPQKQVDAEAWIDTIKHSTGYDLSACDHRLTRPGDFLEADSIAGVALVDRSRWEWTGDGIDFSYRDLARALGGCPDNSIGGRFKIVSILTTAQQLNFVNQVCDPGFQGGGVPVEILLPPGTSPSDGLDADKGAAIFEHLTNLFVARQAYPDEVEEVRGFAEQCNNCSASDFARPTCFAVLSGAEMMFY